MGYLKQNMENAVNLTYKEGIRQVRVTKRSGEILGEGQWSALKHFKTAWKDMAHHWISMNHVLIGFPWPLPFWFQRRQRGPDFKALLCPLMTIELPALRARGSGKGPRSYSESVFLYIRNNNYFKDEKKETSKGATKVGMREA